MRTNKTPLSLADLNCRKKQKQTRIQNFLREVKVKIDFKFCNKWHEEEHGKQKGRKAFDTKVMIKIILLQQWYGLSDAEMEESIYDRNSFQEFLEINANDEIPDETTICRFRKKMIEKKRDKELFKEVDKQLTEDGIKIRKGKIVDATFLETPKGKKKKDGNNTRDKEASFTKKNNRTYHGYKGHISTDTKGEYIQKTHVSTAKDHDSVHETKVLDGDEDAVFGDSAYANKDKKKRYRKEGKFYGIVERAYKNKPLANKQKKKNKKISSVRCRGEHPFAEIKCRMKYKARYIGERKNEWQFKMVALAYNLKRWIGKYNPAQKQAIIWYT